MLGQSKANKFDAKSNNQQLSVILKRTPQTKPHVNLILNQPMQQSVKMQDSLITDCCLFKQPESGYYHISSQVCIAPYQGCLLDWLIVRGGMALLS